MNGRFDRGAYWRELALLVHAREGAAPATVPLPWRPSDVMPLVERLASDRTAREQVRLAVLDAMRVDTLRCDDALVELHWLLGRRRINAARVQGLLHVVGHWLQAEIDDFQAQAWQAQQARPGRRDGAARLRRAIERTLAAGVSGDADVVETVVAATGRPHRTVTQALASYRAQAKDLAAPAGSTADCTRPVADASNLGAHPLG
jgi:hypothetical protein